jgi:hypothetical protein
VKTKLYTFITLACLFCANAFGFTPASGLWFNPSEPGRGFTIDAQGSNVMIITAYVYDSSRKATWFLASGTYSQSSRQFSGTLGSYSGGQCFGCSFSTAAGVPAGTVTVSFATPETAVITYPGGSSPIQHELYGYSSKADYLFGEWNFSTFIAGGIYDTVWVVFPGTTTTSSGTVYATGAEDGVSGTAAVGTYSASSDSFIIVMNDNVGYSHAYVLSGDDKRMSGVGTIFKSSQTPPNPTSTAAGSRLLSRGDLGKSLTGAGDTAELIQIAEQVKKRIESE